MRTKNKVAPAKCNPYFGNNVFFQMSDQKLNSLQVTQMTDYQDGNTFPYKLSTGLYKMIRLKDGRIQYIPLIDDKVDLRKYENTDLTVDAEWFYEKKSTIYTGFIQNPLTERLDLVMDEATEFHNKRSKKVKYEDWFINQYRKVMYLSKQVYMEQDIEDGKGFKLGLIIWDSNSAVPQFSKHYVWGDDVDQYIYVTDKCQTTTIFDVLLLPEKINMWFFFAPKDVEGCIGEREWTKALVERVVDKKRNISGLIKLLNGHEVKLMDSFGAANESLEKWFDAIGVDTGVKTLPEKYAKSRSIEVGEVKGNMDEWKLRQPDEFFQYAMGDVVKFFAALRAHRDQINKILKGAHGDDFPTFDLTGTNAIKRSSGALVARTFERFLFKRRYVAVCCALLLSMPPDMKMKVKDGKKTVEVPAKEVYWEYCENVIREYRSGKWREPNFDVMHSEAFKFHEFLLRHDANWLHGLATASIVGYKVHGRKNTLDVYGAVVQGGRCVNEWVKQNRYDQRINNVIDADLNSCYGSALTSFDFPIGAPRIYSPEAKEQGMRLGDFREKYGSSLVDNLYTIYVSGILPFPQDLLASKYELNVESIERKLTNKDWDGEKDDSENRSDDPLVRGVEKAHLGGVFLHSRKQLNFSILTSVNTDIIDKVATNNEKKELNEVNVDCCVYYAAEDEMTPEELMEYLIKDKKYMRVNENRCHKWCRFSMSEFIQPFIDYRKKLKKQVVYKGDVFDLMQNRVKLFINTTYGNLAAPYFPMGNTVLANNITAKARAGSWMLSKGLLTVQSITDGGLFSWNEVLHFKRIGGKLKKPGLEVLANRAKLRTHQFTRVAPLTDIDVYERMTEWNRLRNSIGELSKQHKELIKDKKFSEAETVQDQMNELAKDKGEIESWIDNLCMSHVNEFWSAYGLELPFKIECKYENTGTAATWLKSADYLIVGTFTALGYVIKSRGANGEEHPKKLELFHNLDPEKHPYPPFLHTEQMMIGVKEFQMNPEKFRYTDENGSEQFQLPGDEQTKYTTPMLLSHGDVFDTYEEYKRDNKSRERIKNDFVNTLRGFHHQHHGDIEKTIQDGRVSFEQHVAYAKSRKLVHDKRRAG